ncbi:MAG TPA: T9SS type A sorting domain-containing protein [Candidatus Kapabacteria bacterium]|nr:T9SS type A sorting domain-containing protein [Candidatus Kapabacteria bacterium]
MRNRYWFVGAKVLLLMAMLLVAASTSQAQVYKRLPILTLVKALRVGTDDVTSQDTQYVAEAGPGEKRYFLLPVYINNTLDSIPNPVKGTGQEPLYSFRFKIQYNRTLLRAVGVQKRGVLPQDTNVAAKNFNLSWDIDEDSTYKLQTIGSKSANGERIMITGSSSLPLPLPLRSDAPPGRTDDRFRDTAVFVYVLFEVVGRAQLSGGGVGNRDQMIITNDTLQWNAYPCTGPFVKVVPPDMVARGFDPNPRAQQGIAPTPIFPINYPNNYGSSVIVITQQPRLELFPPGQVQVVNSDPSKYELSSLMTTTYGNNNFVFRNLLLRNSVPGAILRNVEVATDQPWLRVDTNAPAQVGAGGTPPGDRGLFIREVPNSQINLNIVANPALLPTLDGSGYPTPGLYTGYVTLRSPEASNSAVKLKVTIIVFRNPLEPSLNSGTEPVNSHGIQLLVRNSAPSPDTTFLTFGTGIGARDSIDLLFGEAQAGTPPVPGTFYARFFPAVYDSANPPFNGMVDIRGVTPHTTNGESSIDIRDFKSNTTLVYCVKFSAGAPQNYPLIVEYDTRDFPNGAQIFVRDNINGRFLSTNLRNSTSLGGTRRYFTIQDPNITGFCLEYTLPSIVQFPEIGTGWNFVSLPVLPSDARSSVVFPNISSVKPARFSQNQYQFDDTVQVGIGYFVKYGPLLDKTVAGTRVTKIDELTTPFVVRLYKGWNTVGGLSVPTTIDLITFGPIGALATPNRTGEVYRYVTDRGYEQASLIVPGYGYWIKVDNDGFYRLSAPPSQLPPPKAIPADDPYKALNRLSINDDAQKLGTLYFGQTTSNIDNAQFELPPTPASEMFDVRFDNNGFVSASKDVKAARVVNMQGVQYPVVLSVQNPDADYVVSDAVTGQVLGTFHAGQFNTVTISNSLTKSVRIEGVESAEMSLGSAFPNPASTKFSFDINVPNEQNVSVALYSPLGVEVARLFNGVAKGKQTVEFSTNGLPAGVYYYKMTTEGFSQVRQVVISK